MPNMPNVGQELLNVPFAEMIMQLAFAISEGQKGLDQNSAEVAKFMAETVINLPKIGSMSTPVETIPFSLLSLGFFPGFYQFAESIIEVKMAITMATSSDFSASASASAKWGPFAASVNASYSSKYSYNVEGSSLLRIRIVPNPAPAILTAYMEKLINASSTAVQNAVG